MVTVSVIIPTYNRSRFIEKAINSVLQQTYKDFEIIIVDDGSTDNTRDVIDACGNQIRYFYQTNNGAASARNKGINESKGGYIAFLDSDDYFCKENLFKKISFLEDNLHIGWVYSDWQYVDAKDNHIDKGSHQFSYSQKKLSGEIFEELLYKRNFIATDTVVVRRSVLEDIGFFDPMIPSQEEYDLWLRISLKYTVHYINEPLVSVLAHIDSLSNDFSKWTLGNALIVDKIDKILPKDFICKRGFINRLDADKFTFLARSYAENEEFKKALKAYLQSIKILPLQKRIYWSLMTLLLSSIKYYFNLLVMLKKQK